MRIPHTWKISISFSTNFNKNFACSIYSVTQLWLIWKSSIKIKSSLKTNKCPAKLSPRIICQVSPFLTKCQKTVAPTRRGLSLSPEHLRETLGTVQNPTQHRKMYSFSAWEKCPLIDLNLSLLKVSFPPHQIEIFNHPVQHSFATAVISVASYSKFQDLYTQMSC